MLDQLEIQTVVTKLLHAVDALDWAGIRGTFTADVLIDYTSLFGGEAETLTADALIERWRGLLPGFDATQHMTGPVILVRQDAGSATVETQVRGYHHIAGTEGGVWMVAGMYEIPLRRGEGGWRIAGITLHTAYQEGNLKLPQIAQARAAAKQGRAKP